MPAIFSNSWLGNTFSGATKWVQAHIDGIHVEPNGTVYTTSFYDPSLLECGVYKDGDLIGQLRDNHLPVREPCSAIVTDTEYVYIGVRQKDATKTKLIIRRYSKFKDFDPATFTGSDWSYDRSMLIISEIATSKIVGLAIKGSKLYVAVEGENKLIVIDTTSMTISNIWFISSPGNMAFDKTGYLWIIKKKVGAVTGEVRQYNVETGTVPSLLSTITKLDNPTDICFNSNDELMIVENALDPSIKIYSNSIFQRQFGVTGGSFGVLLEPHRFHGVTGVGCDLDDNYYLACGTGIASSGVDLRKVNPVTNQFAWQLESTFLGESVAANDATNGSVVYGVHERFHFTGNFVKGKEWKKHSFTLDPYTYPEDARLFLSPVSVWHRVYQGNELLFMTDKAQSFIAVYKVNSVGFFVLRPSLLFSSTRLDGGGNTLPYPPFQPTNVDYIWRDLNGDGKFTSSGEYISIAKDSAIGGWSIDSSSNIWKALRNKVIRRFTPQGLDSSGNPIYDYSSNGTSTTTAPTLFTDLRRIEYVPETDTMYLTGFTTLNPAPYEDARVVGSELIRVNNWSGGNRTALWRSVLRSDRTKEPAEILYPISFTVVKGEYAFFAAIRTGEIFVHELASGAIVAELTPDATVGGKRRCGAIDIPHGISAIRQDLSPWESRYVIFVEEPSYNKVLVYYFQP